MKKHRQHLDALTLQLHSLLEVAANGGFDLQFQDALGEVAVRHADPRRHVIGEAHEALARVDLVDDETVAVNLPLVGERIKVIAVFQGDTLFSGPRIFEFTQIVALADIDRAPVRKLSTSIKAWLVLLKSITESTLICLTRPSS